MENRARVQFLCQIQCIDLNRKKKIHVEQESWASTAGNVGPFSMATLRTAETESREEEWNMSHDYTGENKMKES